VLEDAGGQWGGLWLRVLAARYRVERWCVRLGGGMGLHGGGRL
jgi:hypothetical protein